MTFRGLARRWDRFLFLPISPVPVAVYRILLGALVLVDALLLLPELDNFFGERGILPMDDALRLTRHLPLNLLARLPNNSFWLRLFFAGFVLAALNMTVGFFSRLSAALTFVGLATLHHRNMAVLNSADTAMRLGVFCLAFSAAGKALSVDRWLRVRRGLEPPGPPAPAAPWAQRLMQVQLAVAYLATVRWKLAGYTWVDGTAVYYATRLKEFERFPVPLLFNHIRTIQLATWSTLAVELAMATLVWFRDLRYPVLLAGVLLHLGLEYSMNIPLFQWVMLATFVLFIDPRDWRRRRAAAPARPPPPTGPAPPCSPPAGGG